VQVNYEGLYAGFNDVLQQDIETLERLKEKCVHRLEALYGFRCSRNQEQESHMLELPDDLEASETSYVL
jgi:hypothetical protein